MLQKLLRPGAVLLNIDVLTLYSLAVHPGEHDASFVIALVAGLLEIVKCAVTEPVEEQTGVLKFTEMAIAFCILHLGVNVAVLSLRACGAILCECSARSCKKKSGDEQNPEPDPA